MKRAHWIRSTGAMIGIVAALTGCHRQSATLDTPKLPAATVRARPLQPGQHWSVEEVVGTVRPKLRASLEAKISGRIQQLPVAVGQAVKAGELLAQLEVREIQARLDQAVALRELAVLDLQRFTVLRQQQAVTQQEFEVVEAKHRVAQAAATEAETMLGYARVVAPFAGVIARKLAEVGDLALPGRALFELEDPTALRLEAEVPEAIIPRVQLGAKLPVRVATLADSLEGTVAEIAPTSDPNSRTLLVKLDLPPQPRLHGGQFGRVAVPLSQNAVLWAPASAIIQRGQMEILFVVTNQVARLRLVKTGKRLGQEVELLSGVENGESVVVEGAGRLVDGQPVTVR